MKHAIFTEKYKPKSIKEVIGCPKPILKLLENPEQIDHMLLYSTKAGTGKTSIMNALVKDFDGEALFMNASDERKIEDIREKVKRFAQTASISGKRKFVCLDECDGMGKIAQESLKSIMEMYNTIFILTANNVDKIIEPIQSRCKSYMFNLSLPDKEACLRRLVKISMEEGIQISTEAMGKLVDINYPSLRDMIKQLQSISLIKETIEIGDVQATTEAYKIIYDKIKQGKLLDCRKEWLENNYNIKNMLITFFNFSLEDATIRQHLGKVWELFAEIEYRISVRCDADLQMTVGMAKFRSIIK